jgi:23S rRNA (cytidine1920-2'-O)/16S rRNA (cytidine1409-2'-O)-methyltransferase
MRADIYIFAKGLAKSRSFAKTLIESGSVIIDGKTVDKPSLEIDGEEHIVEIISDEKFVSRGGLKLEAALDAFSIDVKDCDALDIGASTGGFTDCLLKRGARSVVCVDSGVGQLDPRIKADTRVTNIEKYNARELDRDIVPNGVDIVVMDVSFISQTLILPKIPQVLKQDGALVSLIKPQFEAGRGAVGKGGIVKSPNDRLAAVIKVRDSADAVGLKMTGLTVSPITGGDGNVEYLAKFTLNGVVLTDAYIKKILS